MTSSLFKKIPVVNRKIILFVLIFSLIGTTIITPKQVKSQNNTIIVDQDGTQDYTSIQTAINNAEKNDTIIVHSGEYRESIVIKKTVKLKGKDTGTGKPVIAGYITVKASQTTIKNFKVTGTNGSGYGIIITENAHNNKFRDLKIEVEGSPGGPSMLPSVVSGIEINSNNNTITENTINLTNYHNARSGSFINDEGKNNNTHNNTVEQTMIYPESEDTESEDTEPEDTPLSTPPSESLSKSDDPHPKSEDKQSDTQRNVWLALIILIGLIVIYLARKRLKNS